MMKAWAKPSGDGCSAYSNFTPNWLPSPKRRLKPGKSNGVEIMSIERRNSKKLSLQERRRGRKDFFNGKEGRVGFRKNNLNIIIEINE